MADLRCEKLSGIMAAQGLLVLLRESIAYRATGPARRRVIRQGKRLQCGLSPDPEPMSISSNHASRGKYAPRYWPTWAGLGLLWCLIHLPYRWQLGVGRFIGRQVMRIAGRRRHIASTNLRLCFPELGEEEHQRLLESYFESMGIGLLEMGMSWWAPSRKLEKLLHIDGLEYLEKALEEGKGAILLSGHFTTMEIGGRLLSMHAPFQVLYRKQKNQAIEAVMKKGRDRFTHKAILRDDLLAMRRSLRENIPVWYAPDQDFGLDKSVFVPFFGILATTITATSRLARASGAPVVPFFQKRLPGAAGYQLNLYPALENFPSDDIEHDTRRINEIIESRIRETPEQYLWAHRRFRTRPAGDAPLY